MVNQSYIINKTLYMKKSAIYYFALFAISSVISLHVKAQSKGSSDDSYQVGTNVISAGFGIGSSIGNGFTYGTQSPGFNLQFEHGFWEAGPGVVSLGAYVGFKSFSDGTSDGTYIYNAKWNYTIIGVRGAWHFTGLNVDHLDLYGGLMLSYNDLSFTSSTNAPVGNGFYNGNYSSTVDLTPFVGAKYYFAGGLGAFGELGYGVNFLSLGLSYKF
jgi:hypothetical protein